MGLTVQPNIYLNTPNVGCFETEGLPSAAVSNDVLNNNVATITTSAPHNFVPGQWVIVAAVTQTALNNNGVPVQLIAGTTGSTLVYNLTHANIGSGADTGSVSACQVQCLNASGTPEIWVTAAGQLVVLTSSGQPLVVANSTTPNTKMAIYHDGSSGNIQTTNGLVLSSTSNGSLQLLDSSNHATVVLNSGAAPGFCAASGVQFTFSSSATLATSGIDSGVMRAAPAVVASSNGSSGKGWLQDSAGTARVATDVTNATATPVNLSTTSETFIAGRNYCGFFPVWALNSVAAEGLQIDMGGGTATFTNLKFSLVATPPVSGVVIGVSTSTAPGTPLTVTTASTTTACYWIAFSGVCNAGGTVILRGASLNPVTGTATFQQGTFLRSMDSPN